MKSLMDEAEFALDGYSYRYRDLVVTRWVWNGGSKRCEWVIWTHSSIIVNCEWFASEVPFWFIYSSVHNHWQWPFISVAAVASSWSLESISMDDRSMMRIEQDELTIMTVEWFCLIHSAMATLFNWPIDSRFNLGTPIVDIQLINGQYLFLYLSFPCSSQALSDLTTFNRKAGHRK